MTTTANPTASELYKQFNLIEDKYNDLLKACTNESQLEQLRHNYTTAFQNYNIAINKKFNYDEKKITDLQDQLVKDGQQLSNALTDIQSISQTLNTIANVVSFGTSFILAT